MMQVGTEAALMLLFVPPTSFDGFGEHPYDGTTLSQLLAGLIVIVSFLSLTLTVCYGLGCFCSACSLNFRAVLGLLPLTI